MTGPVPVDRPDAIIFDCDGVVLESEEMKIAGCVLLPRRIKRDRSSP
jgi:ribonucleotide monophosphatase NagD (HAD superfamily)